MTKGNERDLTRIGWLDYVLMSIGSCLAVYSAGMSIQEQPISIFCIVLVIVGTLVSYAVRILTIKSLWIKFDALFYSGAVIGAIFFSAELRNLMPDGGFPREIAAAGWLSWMIILGSFATWQDSTLLFQAIPALALFGLIGCYDTYQSVTFSFFGFLICLATLFARAHGREMLQKAADSGYFTRGLAPGTPIPSVETTPGLALKLKKGPWRWVAGPEWALASAMAVVLISLLGAPVIRQSVSGVAGFVRLSPPTSRGRVSPASTGGSDVSGQSVRIGRPMTHALPRTLLEAHLDRIRYLRAEVYDLYTGKGWKNTMANSTNDTTPGSPLATLGLSHLKEHRDFNFQIKTLRMMTLLPLPPDVQELWMSDGHAEGATDGTWQVQTSATDGNRVIGKGWEPKPGATPVSGPNIERYDWGSFVSLANIPTRVQELATSVEGLQGTDFEKANRLSQEVSKRILYNLDAPETPSDKDPVEYTLFDQKEGYCTAFASAMVLMSRSIGIPARYCQGYLPDERRHIRNGPYIVTDADYHAWAELYFEDFGWVIFDPTVAASSKEGEGLGDAGDARPWYQRAFARGLFDFLIAATLISGCIIGFVQLKGFRRTSNHRSELDKTYMAFGKQLERIARQRRLVGQTSDEFLETVRPSLGQEYARARELNERFVTAMYSAEAVGSEKVAGLRSDLKLFKAALKNVPRVRKKAGE